MVVDGVLIIDACQGVLVVVCDREEEGAARGAIGAVAVAEPRRTSVPANHFAVVQTHNSDGGTFVVTVGVKRA